MPSKSKTYPNPFYAFLRGLQGPQPVAYQFKTSAAGVSYALIPFALSQQQIEINDRTFTLIENHVSVFSDYTDFSSGSEYHYTATLVDSDNKEYKLHGYFNEQDKCMNLRLAVILPDSSEVSVRLVDSSKRFLTLWVQAEAARVVSILARRQQHDVEEMKENISLQSAQLFEAYPLESDDGMLAQMLRKTIELTKKSKRVLAISPRSKFNYLELLASNIEWHKTHINRQPLGAVVSDKKSIEATASLPLSSRSVAKKSNKQKKSKKKVALQKSGTELTASNFVEKFALLQADYTLLTDKRIEGLLLLENEAQALLAGIGEVVLDIEFASDGFSAAEKKESSLKIQTLHQKVNQYCQELLVEAIKRQDIEAVTQLIIFKLEGPSSLLKLAIDHDDIDLLRLIEKHYACAYNRLLLPVLTEQGIMTDISPLNYAYEQKKPNIFKALLELGANPLLKNASGHSLTHLILSNRHDKIFYPIFWGLLGLMGHKSLLRQLINSLEEDLQSKGDTLSSEAKAQYQRDIVNYKFMFNIDIPVAKGRVGAMVLSKDAGMECQLYELVSDELRAELVEDPEFLTVQQAYQNALSEFTQTVTPQQYRAMSIESREFIAQSCATSKMFTQFYTKDILMHSVKSLTEKLIINTRLLQLGNEASGVLPSNRAANKLNAECASLRQRHSKIDGEAGLHVMNSVLTQSCNKFIENFKSELDSAKASDVKLLANSLTSLFSGESKLEPQQSEEAKPADSDIKAPSL